MTEPSLDHPGTAETDAVPGRQATTRTSRWHKLVGILGLVVALWVGSETYDVVAEDFGGGGSGGGQDTPAGNQDQEIDTDDDHDPSQGGH